MATFSSPTFSSQNYSSFRPRYPSALYDDFLLPYHQGSRGTLLDLGCGPGIVTRPLSAHFKSVIGTDPSGVMLESARENTPSEQYPNITYKQASAEDLPFISDGSVDMVVVGQAAHWFDHSRWWKEMARIVRPGGTVSAWGYRDWVFPQFPRASVLVRQYSNNNDKMGQYWSQPGRSYVDDYLRVLRPPENEWEEVQRWEYDPGFAVPATEEEKKIALKPVEGDDGKPGFGKLVKTGEELMRQTMKLRDVESYWRTWSCLHAWKEKHPQYKARRDGGDGDIIDWAMDEMAAAEGWGDDWPDMEVEVAWGHFVVVARRKQAMTLGYTYRSAGLN